MKLNNNCRSVTFFSIVRAVARCWSWLVALGVLVVGTSHHGPAPCRVLGDRGKEVLARDLSTQEPPLPAQQEGAGAEYDVRPEGAAGPVRQRAVNPVEHTRLEFLDDGVRIVANGTSEASSSHETTLELHLARLGRRGALEHVPAASVPVSRGNRVEYRRGAGLTEWYANGPLGLEQGFTLGVKSEGAGPLVLELALADGLEPRLSNRDGVDLYARSTDSRTPVPAGHYSGLYVEDARGQTLDARLAVVAGAVAITVDDSTATYPIVVDPRITIARRFDSPNGGQFGFAVALDGDTAAIGAASFANSTGAVYTYQRTGTVWSMQQTLLGAAGDQFGVSLALSGNTLFVGAPSNNKTYVFMRPNSTSLWSQLQQLGPALPLNGDYFGFGIALAGSTVMIGDCTRSGNRGASYVFANPTGTSWQQQAELTPNDAQAGDTFGCHSVALSADGNTALVGAPALQAQPPRNGAAYFFSRTGTTWTQFQRVSVGVPGDTFGNSVAIGGLTAFVSAPNRNSNAGSVYPFALSGSTWFQLPEIPGAANDQFGTSLWFDGTTALIGAPGNQAVYQVAENSPGSGWTVQQRLNIAVPGFGQSVALSSSTTFTALVGATLNGVTTDPGAAYAIVPGGGNAVPALGEEKAPLLALVLGLGGVGIFVHGRRRRSAV
jgi:FG-GAP repeat